MPDKKRLQTAQRLLNVRKNQHLVSQWQLTAVENTRKALILRREALEAAETMVSGSPGQYADMVRQHAGLIEARLSEAQHHHLERSDALRDRSQKVEQTKPMVRRFQNIADQKAEGMALDEMIEQMMRKAAASFDQA